MNKTKSECLTSIHISPVVLVLLFTDRQTGTKLYALIYEWVHERKWGI